MNFLWNQLTILWNDLTILWNDLIWKYLTMERNDRILVTREGSLNDIMNARDQASELEGLSCNKTLNLFYLRKKSRAAAENTNETRRYTKLNLSLATRRR